MLNGNAMGALWAMGCLVLAAAGCGGSGATGSACISGEVNDCTCATGGTGRQVCNDEGGYGDCTCTPGGSGSGGSGAANNSTDNSNSTGNGGTGGTQDQQMLTDAELILSQ